MKTTLEISDPLLDEVRKLAARDGTTLRALVERGLHHVVTEKKAKPFKLRDGSFKGNGLNPDRAGASWEKIAILPMTGPAIDCGRYEYPRLCPPRGVAAPIEPPSGA